jgi:hypothetical protein
MFTSSRRTRLVALALVALIITGLALHRRERGSTEAPSALARSEVAVAAQTRQASAVVDTIPVASVAAPSRPAPALFSYVHPANAVELDAVLRAPTHRIHYVRLDQALIAGKQSPFWQNPDQGRLTLPLPEGEAVTVLIHGSEMLGAQRFTSVGAIEGRPQSRAIFAYDEGFVRAVIEDPELGSYELRAGDGDLEQFYQVDPALVPPCGGALHREADADAIAEAARRTAQAAAVRGAAGEPSGESTATAGADPVGANVVVHLMMLYTQGVRANFSGTQRVAVIQSDFDGALAQVNDDFARSLISARVKLVKIAEVSYPGDEVDPDFPAGTVNWQKNVLNAVTSSTDTGPGAMNEIHALRDQVGADLVNVIQHRSDSSSSGISWIFDTPGDNFNSTRGFSVVSDAYLTANHTFSHELGHNLGNAHARGDANSTGTKDGAYTYSYGYRFTGQNGRTYHDIMAYDPGSRLSYFSNPDLIAPAPASVPLGIPIGSTGETDAALTIDQTAFEVASYRLQVQTATNTGTLVNVSTRAFVGTGEAQMIGGFVISGAAPKKMLIRAAGPALTAYGVSGVLPDPKITLVPETATTDPNPINDTGWEKQTGSSSGVTAADITNAVPGAFPFAKGSKDAALLLTLSPGNYTAKVESVGNSTGVALLEAYEVDRNNNKLFNLSTRAYASKESPIFGGFVVQGDPGTTKRILIRVLGPSLADFKISNPLNDPILYLFNASSELLMKNDDWDVNVGSTGGSPDDGKPVPTYYSEKQIANTGFAPFNRREPCILVDLPPGLYTAVVRPFESSSQAAQPGIGIIEVFEINP